VSAPLRHAWREVGGGPVATVVLAVEGGRLSGEADGEALEGDGRATGPADLVLREGGRVHRAVVVRDGRDVLVWVGSHAYRLRLADEERAEGEETSAEPFATSPMTGLVAKVSVAPGDRVEAGAVVFVVEAMKMEYVVRAPAAAVVREVRRRPGERVEQGEVVVAFDGAVAPAGAGGEAG
jgi:3-methylcrotonyl-CoA carboxylase alpha subunit